MDLYSLYSLAPSLVIVAAMIIGIFFGVKAIKKAIDRDAEQAGE